MHNAKRVRWRGGKALKGGWRKRQEGRSLTISFYNRESLSVEQTIKIWRRPPTPLTIHHEPRWSVVGSMLKQDGSFKPNKRPFKSGLAKGTNRKRMQERNLTKSTCQRTFFDGQVSCLLLFTWRGADSDDGWWLHSSTKQDAVLLSYTHKNLI
jgi:hypothetical protein